MHGGLSPDISTLDQIRVIERNQEIPYKGNFKKFKLFIKLLYYKIKLVMFLNKYYYRKLLF